MNWHWAKWSLWRKPSRRSWQENTHTTLPPPLFYVGGVQKNAYFHSSGNYRLCGQIGCQETFREFRTRRYWPRSSTGVAFRIWGGQQKLRTIVEAFVNYLDNQSPPWAAYRAFMYGRLIALNKNMSVHWNDLNSFPFMAIWSSFFFNCNCHWLLLFLQHRNGTDRFLYNM